VTQKRRDCAMCVEYHSNRKREAKRKRTLKMLPIFRVFVTPLQDSVYEIDIFFKLADNGLFGCSPAVVFE